MSILIKNGQLIDPKNNINAKLDILIDNGKVVEIAESINKKTKTIINAKGMIVAPGLVDMHVHLREPGREDKETIQSATNAAAKGGVTTLLSMPNTTPAVDSQDIIKYIKESIKKTAKVNVEIAGAITIARDGEILTDIAALKKEGVIAITDDGASVDDRALFLKALKESKKHGILVIEHCEDTSLSKNGSVNLGLTSTRMGLRGISNESEYKRIARDIELAEKTSSRIHIAHVSCKESVDIIRKAKKKKVNITAETAPHYFSFTESDVLGFDTNFKMNPPLRSAEDKKAVIEGLQDNTIDVIASDHAPHTENEKDIEFDRAEFGIIGLETELSAGVMELVDKGFLTWESLIKKLSVNPSKVLGLDKGSLAKGSIADCVIIDPDSEWVYSKDTILSKSDNSPFINKPLKAEVVYTIVKGKIVYERKVSK